MSGGARRAPLPRPSCQAARELAKTTMFLIEVWSVDLAISPLYDLTQEEFVKMLEDLCLLGMFHGILAAPPCNTWLGFIAAYNTGRNKDNVFGNTENPEVQQANEMVAVFLET